MKPLVPLRVHAYAAIALAGLVLARVHFMLMQKILVLCHMTVMHIFVLQALLLVHVLPLLAMALVHFFPLAMVAGVNLVAIMGIIITIVAFAKDLATAGRAGSFPPGALLAH